MTCVCDRWLPPWGWWLLTGLVAILATCSRSEGADGDGVPLWLLHGILKRETSSYYRAGVVVYVDQADGLDGELGPFQMTPAAFDEVARRGDVFTDLRTDHDLAARLCLRYLVLLRKRWGLPDTDRGWRLVARHYNAGGNPDLAKQYAADVWRFGIAAMTPGKAAR